MIREGIMIGVLTFHHVYNYGAILQTFALQKFISDNNYEVKVIDIRPFDRNIKP